MSGMMAVKRRLIYTTDEYADRKDWVFAVHIARVKLILDASALSDGGWKIDTDKLTGEKPYTDPDSKEQTAGAVYDYAPANGCAYGTFLKYEKDSKKRYLFVFTCWGMEIVNEETPDVSTSTFFPIYYNNLRGSDASATYAYIHYPGTMGYSYGDNPFIGTSPKDRSFLDLSSNTPILPAANEMYVYYKGSTSGTVKYYGTEHAGTIPMIDSGKYIDLICAADSEKIATMFHYSDWADGVWTCSILGDLVETQVADAASTKKGAVANLFSYYEQRSIYSRSSQKTAYAELTAPTLEENVESMSRTVTQTSTGAWAIASITWFGSLLLTQSTASVTPYTLPLIISIGESISPNGWLAKGFFGAGLLRAVKSTGVATSTVIDGDFIYFGNLMLAWDKSNAARVGF